MEEVIYAYTRKQAIEDGVLIDVSERAQEAGFRVPVALTTAAWAECVSVAHGLSDQDETGRLWDVLWMCRFYASQHQAGGPEILFRLVVKKRAGKLEKVMLKAICGPDDDGSPCVTIMLPNEDEPAANDTRPGEWPGPFNESRNDMETGTNKIPANETLPPEVAKAIEEVLWFYWQEQLEAFAYDPPVDGEDHCFQHLVAIDQWFYGHDDTAEQIVADFDAENEAAVQRLKNTRDE